MDALAVSEEIAELAEIEESKDRGSFNHGYIQVRLGILFDRLGQYTPVNEVGLDVSGVDLSQFELKTKEEFKPDVCLYPKCSLSRPKDILKMKEMPFLAVEIFHQNKEPTTSWRSLGFILRWAFNLVG